MGKEIERIFEDISSARHYLLGLFFSVKAGRLGSLPKPLRKLGRILAAIFTGKRPNKAGRLVPVTRLENRNYLMVLCSIDPPAYG